MNLSAETRRQIMISHEGQILSHVGSSGIEMTGDLVRCYLDGAINALIRLEGAEAATRFAFALSDRAAGGLRDGTPVFPVIFDEIAPIAEAARDSVLAAVAAALDDDDDEPDDPAPERFVAAKQGLPTWFIYWAMTLGIFAGWIVGRGWPT